MYVEGTRPSTEVTSCPLDADGGCMDQGDGYQVLSVRARTVKSKFTSLSPSPNESPYCETHLFVVRFPETRYPGDVNPNTAA